MYYYYICSFELSFEYIFEVSFETYIKAYFINKIRKNLGLNKFYLNLDLILR